MITDLSRLCVGPESSIREGMACIDENDAHIALVVDGSRRLLDTITDGDVRRAILAGIDLDSPLSVLLERRSTSPYPEPVTARAGTEPGALLQIMRDRRVRQLPLLDASNRVIGVVTRLELAAGEPLPLHAVIMAGGYGNRLRPLTDSLPKPMLPVGEKPLMELIVEQLRDAGVSVVNVTTHYKGDVIADHFKDGSGFGVAMSYIEEKEPLGTAGALSLLEKTDSPLLVINGDIVTRVDFRAMLDFHQEHEADMTVALKPYEIKVPYGVVDCDGVSIRGISEKPNVKHFINAGIYLLNPDVLDYIPTGESYDMPELVNRLGEMGRRVVGFPVREYWLDIGQIEDYHRAQDEVETSGEPRDG